MLQLLYSLWIGSKKGLKFNMKRQTPQQTLEIANVNHFFTLLGKMFFTPYGKEFFTSLSKQIFTS